MHVQSIAYGLCKRVMILCMGFIAFRKKLNLEDNSNPENYVLNEQGN